MEESGAVRRVRVAALHLYPVKSCAGIALESAAVGALGLEGDRRFAIAGADGRPLTQRQLPLLATIRPLARAGAPALDLGGLATVEPAPGISARLSEYLGMRAQLIALAACAAASFADAAPVLAVARESLAALNAKLRAPVGIERFRANLVLEGAQPFSEPAWGALEAQGAAFALAAPCERCEVTTIDQARGERRGQEPLATLAAAHDSVFGAYFRVSRGGRITVGDELTVV